MARSRDELLQKLGQQIGLLVRAIESFDAGHLDEALNMASRVRVIVHHTADLPRGSSHSLINQLGLQNALTWVDTAGVVEPETTNPLPVSGHYPASGLTVVQFSSAGIEYVAPSGNYRPSPILTRSGQRTPRGSRIPFEEWWTNIVIRDTEGNEFSRRELVLALANKEGGAHVDPVAKADYEALAKSNSLGFSIRIGDEEPRPMESDPVPPSMRQISWEVYESLRQQRGLINGVSTPDVDQA